jgi:peptidoglycan hydrolase-like protein with peptidoglycan-binding domain
MAAAQYPLDGRPGKAWKVTSPFGWRVHPIKKTRKHHNGTDIWQAKEPSYLEACFDGKVIAVKENTDPNSAGNSVIVQSTVMGKKITWTYFHMVHKSIQVKKGQKVTAGQVIGKMGATGFATGKHLHIEIWAGHRTSQPNINSGGKGFHDPMKFIPAAIAWEKTNAEAPKETPTDAPATPIPNHSLPIEDVVPPKAKAAKPALSGYLKVGSKGGSVKFLQTALGLKADGIFGEATKKAVIALQKKHKLTADGIVGPVTWSKI